MKRKSFFYLLIPVLIIIVLLGGQVIGAEGGEKVEEPLVSIMLFQTDLREALSEISIQTGVNIIPDQTVGGIVTADIQEVPLEKALRMILIGGGYTFRKIDDFYLVGLPDPENNTFGELSELKVVQLEDVSVDELLNILPSFLSDYVKGDTESNTVTISAPPTELKRILDLINEIDYPQKQIEIKVLITEVDSKEIKELGSSLFEYDEGESGVNRFSYNNSDNLLVLETDHYGQLLSKLKAMQEESKARIEANPSVVIADGETAQLFIGEQQIILIEDEDDSDINTRVEEFEVGVGLEATASIRGEDDILLNLSPTISHFLNDSGPNLVIKESEVTTTLKIKDGQTVALAGMTLKDDSSSSKQVPVLGSIPLIRWLFRNESDIKASKELLIFVTAVIK